MASRRRALAQRLLRCGTCNALDAPADCELMLGLSSRPPDGAHHQARLVIKTLRSQPLLGKRWLRAERAAPRARATQPPAAAISSDSLL